MERFTPYLADINNLSCTVKVDAKKEYVQPALKNVGNLSLVLIREAIAPVIFRNAEEEITDIEVKNTTYIRGVPNKFKYPEKGRSLQILRALGVGGKHPQNKTTLQPKKMPSEAYDLNTLVFGDSVVQDGRVLSVKAAVNYSDALSVLRKELCVDSSFHNAAMEDGSLFDADTKKNSNSLFTRHFIRPGSLMVQVLSTRGKLLPQIGLDHLLLSIGVAGAYGGQTSVTGTNIKTHIVGIYGGNYENALSSPYELIKALDPDNEEKGTDVTAVSEHLHNLLNDAYPTVMTGEEAQAYMEGLLQRFDDNSLKKDYEEAKTHIDKYFDNWFGSGSK